MSAASELPTRLLLGPGPSNVHADVLEAMAQPLIGHLDPEFLALLDHVQSDLRQLFGTQNAFTLPLSAPGSAGMETCLVNLLEPGDHAVIGINGVFGGRMADVATRAGARVTRVESPWGQPLDPEAMERVISKESPDVVAFVHAETSTGVLQPPELIAQAARQQGSLVVLDCVTSLAGVDIQLDRWGIDAAYSGTQKCLSCSPGISPLSMSERALERVQSRRSPVQSWFMDVSLLHGYFGSQRVYHHTAPVTAIYGLAEGLRRVLEEGMPSRIARHREASAALIAELENLGFEALVDSDFRLPPLTTVRLPSAVLTAGTEAKLRARLLSRHGIEVGGGLGELAGQVWRIGLMGENARMDCVARLVGALKQELGTADQ